MLPVVPLVILVCVSTMRRRIRRWTWWIAVTCAAFVVQLFVPPPYRIAPEDTLLYRDYVVLHKLAAERAVSQSIRTLAFSPPGPLPTNSLHPFLGYVKQPLNVVRLKNFSPLEIERASQATDQFDVAYLFSTKWEPLHPLLEGLAFGKPLQERFFDYHEDFSPRRAADILGGRTATHLTATMSGSH
jgi:hypothetical protein